MYAVARGKRMWQGGEGSGLHNRIRILTATGTSNRDWKQWRLCALYARSGPTANRQQEIHFAFAVVQVVAKSRWIGVTLDSLVARTSVAYIRLQILQYGYAEDNLPISPVLLTGQLLHAG